MGLLRAFIKTRAVLATLIVALALGLRVLVPAGFMLAERPAGLVLTICPDAAGQTAPVLVAPPSGHGGHHTGAGHAVAANDAPPGATEHGEESHGVKPPCPYAVMGLAMLAGADPPLLAMALAFILPLGFAPRAAPALPARPFLRPPLRGPPAPA